MFYNLAMLSYTASLFFTAFTVTNMENSIEAIPGYHCLFLCIFGVFGLNPYCWSNLFFLVWFGEAISKKQRKLCLIYSMAAIIGALSFLLVTKFPLNEAGGFYGTIQSYGLGFYLWIGSFVFALLHSLTLKDNDSVRAPENNKANL